MTPQTFDILQRRAEGYRELLSLPNPKGDTLPRCHFWTHTGDPGRFQRWSYLPTAHAAWKAEQMRPVAP